MGMKLDISVINVDKAKTLIDLLGANQHRLPDDIIESVREIADCEHCEIGHQEVVAMGHKQGDEITNSAGINDIVSVNPILRRVKATGQPDQFPASFSLWSGDKLLVSW